MLAIQHGLMLTANMRPTWSQVGPQKIDLGVPMGRQDLPKLGANLDPINRIFRCPSWAPFWGGLGDPGAPQSIFFEAQEPPQNPLKNEVS